MPWLSTGTRSGTPAWTTSFRPCPLSAPCLLAALHLLLAVSGRRDASVAMPPLLAPSRDPLSPVRAYAASMTVRGRLRISAFPLAPGREMATPAAAISCSTAVRRPSSSSPRFHLRWQFFSQYWCQQKSSAALVAAPCNRPPPRGCRRPANRLLGCCEPCCTV